MGPLQKINSSRKSKSRSKYSVTRANAYPNIVMIGLLTGDDGPLKDVKLRREILD